MARTIFENNDVEIVAENSDLNEMQINVIVSHRGTNMIWISASDEDEFKREFNDLMAKYMI